MLNIATINVQNKYKLKKYNGLYKNEDHVKMLVSLINKYKLDIIGLQEVNERYFERIKTNLEKRFVCYGNFRYPKSFITRNFYPFSTYNESVPIITNRKILNKKTKLLPWISSYVPRIVTIMELEIKELGLITVLNTHIDYLKNKTKIKQLNRLEEIINNIKVPVILMGDFNMTIKNKNFKKFIENMEKLNIKRVDIKEKTYKYFEDEFAIDHIFISNCFNVEEIIIEKNETYNNFSDHYPVILRLSINNNNSN